MIVKMSLPVDATIHDCQNITPSGRYNSCLSKFHSQWTLRFMTVKIPSHAACSGKFWPNQTYFLICLPNTNTVSSTLWVWNKHTGMMKCFQNVRAETEARRKIEWITRKCFVDIKLAEDKMVSPRGVQWRVRATRLLSFLATQYIFQLCLCDAERFGRGSMWKSGVSCLIVGWKCEFLWRSVGSSCGCF